ncbi:efflux RND transporter periplasmic adaptor subunit [Sphingomonas sp. AP4-R1]|uniref:efflux RND transporter periplasmic adaptor subunit n=1 Tax=Sphingomonas sp. AP4-R1 TaxID=2735134 RepID=UPI0014933B53|nr:efflux RND transporter periplasmic adaptor subunit [Sphingomonas sp. AP4-R1]QJU57352.1 efflux RND transporter periplasmic adaptor subunit [Sphingomonas sp. AP4-R1]
MQNDPLPDQKIRKRLRVAGAVAAIAAIGVVAAGTISRASQTKEAQQWADNTAVSTVHLITVSGNEEGQPLILPATMQAWVGSKLYARVPGYVRSWQHDIGAHVSAGESLGVIDTPELDQQIVAARAQLDMATAAQKLATSTAARWNDLLSDRSVSKQEADEKNGDLATKKAAVNAAKANLGQLMAMKAFAVIRAPFAGTLTARNADIGDLVGPNASAQRPIFAVAQTSRIRIYANVPQSYSAQMRPGVKAQLVLPDYPGRSFTAEIIGNSGAIDTQTGNLQIQLAADNADGALKPGGFAQVKFALPARTDVVEVPSSTLIYRGTSPQVATVDPTGHIHMRPLILGRDLGRTVEILSGLHSGDHIVDNPPDSLAEKDLVKVGAASNA